MVDSDLQYVDLEEVFDELLEICGPTSWWPADSDFEIVIGAILTQNTRWENVKSALYRLKHARMMDPESIAYAGLDLAEFIRPAGYPNKKATYLRAISTWVLDYGIDEYSEAASWNDDRLRSSLLSVRGVGPETADDILLYVFHRRVFIADMYARRLFQARDYDVPKGYESFRKAIAPAVEECSLNSDDFGMLHGLIVEYGKSH
ncbi:endonuclease III domain-containing protein [Actinomyces vulturis]|uniref:endonuclease III domain-containing protein n=1 Tax=Actinomyces vulturis TaxID=1857645 RepID=UPI00083521D2|nr:hypothetical protein [Actinomyces vulturis]